MKERCLADQKEKTLVNVSAIIRDSHCKCEILGFKILEGNSKCGTSAFSNLSALDSFALNLAGIK